MPLDLPTLSLALFSVSLTLTVAVLYVAWGSPEEDGLGVWGVGLLLHALYYPAFMLRLEGWPVASILLTSPLIMATFALQAQALARFQGSRVRALPPLLVWVPVVLAPLAAWLLLHDNQLRSFCLGLILLLQAVFLLFMVCRRRPPGPMERGRQLLVAGSLLLLGLVGLRVTFTLLPGNWSGPLMVPLAMQGLTYLAVLGVMVLNTLGFVLMQKERALTLQREAASHDALTGAANRRALNHALERGLSRAARSGLPLSLLMVDIDWFKKVNDNFGHQAGDGVLCGLVQRLQQRLRPYDLLARFGGEEFVVLLSDTDADGAYALAEDLRREVEAMPFAAEGHVIPVTVSLGVATLYPTGAPAEADRLLARADTALYQAKQNGRNRVEVAAPVPLSPQEAPKKKG